MIVNLNKNKFYTICKSDGDTIVVNGSDGGALSVNNIGENSNVQKNISIAEEQILLHDGKNLKRIRDRLIVVKGEWWIINF